MNESEALQRLYRAPLSEFTAERKRLAEELRAGREKAAATELMKRRRPTTSAWTVNQLYWRRLDAFRDLLAAAARLRKGDLGATNDYRDALAQLRKEAAGVLKDAGLKPADATLNRVAATLAAIAANGGFEPDAPGTLAADRNPPGFETVASSLHGSARRTPSVPAQARREVAERAESATDRAEMKRREAERARREAERRRLETRARAARAEVGKQERRLAALKRDLAAAEKAVADAQEVVRDLERRLKDLGA